MSCLPASPQPGGEGERVGGVLRPVVRQVGLRSGLKNGPDCAKTLVLVGAALMKQSTS